MAYVENVAEAISFSTGLSGYHLFNYVDKDDLDMNALVSTVRKQLFGKDGVGVRLPAWLGIIGGYGFDVLAKITKRKLPVSSVRVRKFMKTTSFDTCVEDLGFEARFRS